MGKVEEVGKVKEVKKVRKVEKEKIKVAVPFITFEGPEGSGKTTQLNKLASYLKSKGFDVVKTREPGGSDIAEKIRKILLDSKNIGLNSKAELFLYLASRAQHIQDVIKPALRRGVVVLCDRFSDSTIAYQGYGRGISKSLISELNKFVTNGIKPDLTIYLDINVKSGLKRANVLKGKKDRLERESVVFHNLVRNGYFKIAKLEPDRVKIIRAIGDVNKIHYKIKQYIEKLC
ncbi:MAG: dTMP kinase [Candidatus Firestonebacteria bacterium]